MRLLDETLRVADDTGDQPSDGLDHRHRRDLSPVEDVVAETDESHLAERRGVREDALVDALVAPAPEHEVLAVRELPSGGLGEDLARRRREDDDGSIDRGIRGDRVERLTPRLGFHHHAGASAVGRVVDRAVAVVGPVAQVVHAHVEQTAAARLAQKRHFEDVEERREDRDDVDAHVSPPGSRPRQAGLRTDPAEE